MCYLVSSDVAVTERVQIELSGIFLIGQQEAGTKMSFQLPSFYFFKILFVYFQTEGKGRRKRGKHQYVVASQAPPISDLAHNPGMCPDWESNLQPFGLQARSHSSELHQPGLNSLLTPRLQDSVNCLIEYALIYETIDFLLHQFHPSPTILQVLYLFFCSSKKKCKDYFNISIPPCTGKFHSMD